MTHEGYRHCDTPLSLQIFEPIRSRDLDCYRFSIEVEPDMSAWQYPGASTTVPVRYAAGHVAGWVIQGPEAFRPTALTLL